MATGTRELHVLTPEHLAERVDALLLTGGSAFGLAAADGVVSWLASRGRGFETGVSPVPLVPGAVIFDLAEGVERPGPEEGRRASEEASSNPVPEGRVGAGAGATVGKVLGPSGASPGGVGSSSRGWKSGTVGALAVVNALGDILAADGTRLTGPRDADGRTRTSDEVLGNLGAWGPFLPGTNTTLVVLATDLSLPRIDLARLAGMVSAALPRAISPVFTPFDGDLLFAVSTSDREEPFLPQDLLSLGVVAREAVEEAIRRVAAAGQGPGS
jgi:L-aminopeptidase/D-esterase-like protein